MSTVALTGSDTIVLNGRVILDLADGDCVHVTYPNDISQVKTGKNGNSLYALNESGKQCDVSVRLIRGSADDKFLNGLLQQQQLSFASTVLMIGQFVKQVGDGAGNIGNDTYIMSGGIFTKQVEAKSNVEGDTEQSISIYTIKFANSPRVIT